MWQKLRVTVLLLILATVAWQALLDQEALKWRQGFNVAIYPINADRSSNVSAYLQTLTASDFEPVEAYFTSQAEPYGLNFKQPITLYIGDEISKIPPAPPKSQSALRAIIWSLKFRIYAWLNSPKLAVKPDIRMYLLYYDPRHYKVLSHSSALSKGRIGRVNLYGDAVYNQQNLVIFAHELLHTLSATDKYDLITNLPSYPQGYIEPDKEPLYPQAYAELMAGRIPRAKHHADIPKNLSETSIGDITAREIGWLK
jgi:hypothetical protein